MDGAPRYSNLIKMLPGPSLPYLCEQQNISWNKEKNKIFDQSFKVYIYEQTRIIKSTRYYQLFQPEYCWKPVKPKPDQIEAVAESPDDARQADRLPNEIERDKKLNAETFLPPHEMATITVLADIIIPKDEKSGSASDAKVPEFIEFIVKDMPDHQVPMRGGLRWLDITMP